MLPALLAITAFLALGHAVLGALVWALVNVPESNALMVASSALLGLAVVAGVAWVETLGWLSWTAADDRMARARRALRGMPACLAALVLCLFFYWLTGRAETWLADHRGEMDAWLILHLSLVKSGPVHVALGWLVWFVRYPLALTLGLGLLSDVPGAATPAAEPAPASARRSRNRSSILFAAGSWLRRSLNPLCLALVTLWVLVLIWLPWQAVNWRPKAIPATWLEPAFVAVKLLGIYLLANLGWALVLGTTRRAPR